MSTPRHPRLDADDEGLRRLAVLIDADNAQASVIDALLAEVASHGEATVRRIYGDFTSPSSAQWKKVLHRHAIKPVQQFAYTSGKNATDSMLIIDAMDLLYTRRFDGFCLVSSDSDFTGLALRIREEGLLVLGFGERKTPEAFRNACHRFVFTELLKPAPAASRAAARKAEARSEDKPDPGKASAEDAPSPAVESTEFPRALVAQALEMGADDEGWVHLPVLGSNLNKLQPDFDARLYGYRKLSDLVRGMREVFEVKERQIPGSDTRSLYVRGRG